GTFGAPVELDAGGDEDPHIALGIQGDGTTLALVQNAARLLFLTAPPGGPFGSPQTLTTDAGDGPLLTVAPDGRALAAVPEADAHTQIFERPPGGAFAPVADIPFASTFFGGLALALRPDGAAIVTYTDPAQQMFALRRDRPGGFGARVKVGP